MNLREQEDNFSWLEAFCFVVTGIVVFVMILLMSTGLFGLGGIYG